MAELKTKPNDASVERFLASIEDDPRREDSLAVSKLMRRVVRAKPVMWGDSIVGFGRYHYRYASGREGDWFLTGFSPRKRELVLYIMPGFERYGGLLKKLGKHKTGRGCLYLRRLEDVDVDVLRELVSQSVTFLRNRYPIKKK